MRLAVAMSGGVDSATVAALLAEAGHEVVGLTLQLYDHGAATGRRGACCAGADIHDARRVADRLGIAHYVIDAQARFADTVIAPFVDSYAAGETPVPCIACNMGVKFTDLLGTARALGCAALATGHYARIEPGPELHRAVDPARDQSWFLAMTTREQLGFLRFPLGGMADKAATRAEAARLGLALAAKPDSQDICFVPTGRYTALVGRLRPEAMAGGEIVGADGAVLGAHAGIAGFTVGQRRGLGDAAMRNGVAQRVIRIEPERRRVVVGPCDGGTQSLRLARVNWLVAKPGAGLGCAARLRARGPMVEARVTPEGDGALVSLSAPALSAPGQACVFYSGERVLGAGFIARD